MKKLFTICVLLLIFNAMVAQDRAVSPPQFRNVAVKAEYLRPGECPALFVNLANQAVRSETITPEETTIGETFYDLQSNTLLANRFHLFTDGTLGAVWTMGMEATTFPDRGTGYNYFDGTIWDEPPAARLENLRCGWPSYAPLGEHGEIVVSHDFAAHDLYFLKRPDKGTGEWSQTLYEYVGGPANLSWPRIVTSGDLNQNVHLLANTFDTYLGQTTAIVYSRSTDEGLTWDIQNTLLDGTGSDFYTEIGGDDYVWAESRGNTIAFLVAGAWHDMFMMKSTDNGDNWEKTVIWENPYPMFDWNVTITDTFFCVDNSAYIVLDANEKAHVVFGINRVLHNAVGTSYFLFPYIDGIGYWNEDMPTFSHNRDALAPPLYGYPNSEMVEDLNYIGWTQDVNGNGTIDFVGAPFFYRELGVSTMPSLAIDDAGTMYLAYASTTETYDNVDYNYKHIWVRAYQNGFWGPFVDLTKDIIHIFDECIYPQIAGVSSSYLHLIYNADATPGIAVDGAHDYQQNRIVYSKVPVGDVLTGIKEAGMDNSEIEVSQNYPNPFNNETDFSIVLNKASHVTIEVCTLTGQLVMNIDQGFLQPGTHKVVIEAAGLEKGVYYYTVRTGKNTVTKKMTII
jgi:hypothetical protein